MDKIVIGQFDIDTEAVNRKLAENNQAISFNKEILKSLNKENIEYSKSIRKASEEIIKETINQKLLNERLKEGSINQSQYDDAIKSSNQSIEQNTLRINELSNAQKEANRDIIDTQRNIKELSVEQKKLESVYQGLNSAQSGIIDNYSREDKSINQLREDNKELYNLRNNLALSLGEESQAVKKLNAIIDENNKVIKENGTETEKRIFNIGNYKEAITEASSEIAVGLKQISSGDVIGGFDTLKGGFSSLKAQASELWAVLLSNPLTAIVAGVTAIGAGIFAGTKAIFDYNESISKNVQLIENLTGKTGEAADNIRNNITGLSETFGIEFKDIANAVDNLIDTGVAKDELQALEQIKNGLLTAPDKNEFISSLENTALTAKNVKLDLEEVISAKESIEAKGIDGDALFGSLNKASLKLAEGSKGLSETLKTSFGAGFTDDILERVRFGSLSTIDALELINQKGQEVGLNAQEQANLQIELFGKQSLQAGGYAEIMGVVNDTYLKSKQPLTDLQKAVNDVAESNINLAKARDNAMKSDTVLLLQKQYEIFSNNIKISFFSAFGEISSFFGKIFNSVSELFKSFGIEMNVFDMLFINLKVTLNSVLYPFKLVWEIIKALGGAISDSIAELKEYIHGNKTLQEALTTIRSAFSKVYDIISDVIGSFSSLGGEGSTLGNIFRWILRNALEPLLKNIEFVIVKTAGAISSFKNWYNSSSFLSNGLRGLINILQNIPQFFNAIITTARNSTNLIGQAFLELGSLIKNALTLDFKSAEANWNRLKSLAGNVKNEFNKNFNSEIGKKQTQSTLDSIQATNQLVIDSIERNKKQAEENKANKIDPSGESSINQKEKKEKPVKTKKIDDAEKKLEKEKELLKKQAENEEKSLEDLAKTKVDIAKNELEKYIANNLSKLENEKLLTQSIIDEENKRLDEKNKLKQKELEEQLKLDRLKLKSEQERLDALKLLSDDQLKKEGLNKEILLNQQQVLNDNKKLLEEGYQNDIKELDNANKKQQLDNQKKYEEQLETLRKTSRALSYQLELEDLETQGASKYEIQRTQLDNETQQKIDKFLSDFGIERQLDENNNTAEEELKAQRQLAEQELKNATDEAEVLQAKNKLDSITLLEKEYAENNKKITQAETKERLSAYSDLFGNISKLLGENTAAGKAAAIAQATINTFQGVTEVFRAPSVLPEPFGTIAKVASAGVVVASGLSAVKQISGTKTPKAEKGMLLNGNSHAQGGIDILVGGKDVINAEGGEAIINKEATRKNLGLLSLINQSTGGVPFYASGGVTGSSIASVQSSVTDSSNNIGAIMADSVYKGSRDGTYGGSSKGISDYSINKSVTENASF